MNEYIHTRTHTSDVPNIQYSLIENKKHIPE